MSKISIVFDGKELTLSRFNEIEKFVLEYFHSLWDDIRVSIYTLRENQTKLLKSEVCLAFIGADSLSRFREIITTGKEEKSSEDRLREWLDEFVFDQRNEVYKKYSKEINLDSATAWKLRNSLVHFYGLPRLKSEYIGFGTLDQMLLKEFRKSFAHNHPGKQVRVVNPYRFIEAMLSGFLLQLEILADTIKGDSDSEKEEYAKGIVQFYEIIQNEGTVFVPFL